MTTRTTPNGPERLDPAQLAAALDRSVADADNHRAGGLGAAAAITAAHADAIDLESARVGAKYGASSPQAVEMQARSAIQSAVVAVVNADSERATIGVPTVPANTAVVFGRVVTASGAGVAQMTVAALDAHGVSLAFTCSVATGAYSLTIPFTQPGGAANDQAVTLLVSDLAQAVRLHDAQPTTVSINKTVYRELVLGDPTTPCAPPPDPKKIAAEAKAAADARAAADKLASDAKAVEAKAAADAKAAEAKALADAKAAAKTDKPGGTGKRGKP